MKERECKQLADFMKTQVEIIHKHLDEHCYLRKMDNKNEALNSFIEDYGWLIRELYCTKICKFRDDCEIADDLREKGDLLRDHLK